jgi:hypothetical protein
MRSVCVVLFVLASACGSSSSGGPDGGGGDDDIDGGIDPTGDGGTNQPHAVTLTLTNRPNNGAPFSFFVASEPVELVVTWLAVSGGACLLERITTRQKSDGAGE